MLNCIYFRIDSVKYLIKLITFADEKNFVLSEVSVTIDFIG